MNLFKGLIRSSLNRLGVDIRRYPEPPRPPMPDDLLIRRMHFINECRANVVLDVGAHIGNYAQSLRKLGYGGKIISFEPVSEAFVQLSQAANSDEQWQLRRIALGDVDGTVEINIASNFESSSILQMCDRHLVAAPYSTYTATETVTINRLDSLQVELLNTSDRAYLKLDTQGYEMPVLKGAQRTLEQIYGIEMEMSLVPLYQGQELYRQMINYLEKLNFELVSLDRGFTDLQSGHVLQVDGIFLKH